MRRGKRKGRSFRLATLERGGREESKGGVEKGGDWKGDRYEAKKGTGGEGLSVGMAGLGCREPKKGYLASAAKIKDVSERGSRKTKQTPR